MKKIFLYPALIVFTAGALLSYKQAPVANNLTITDTIPATRINPLTIRPNTYRAFNDTLPPASIDTLSEWQQFKKEAGGKIDENETNINMIKADLVTRSEKTKIQYQSVVTDLEVKNKDLQKRMSGYEVDGKEALATFKKKMNGEIESVKKSLGKIKL